MIVALKICWLAASLSPRLPFNTPRGRWGLGTRLVSSLHTVFAICIVCSAVDSLCVLVCTDQFDWSRAKLSGNCPHTNWVSGWWDTISLHCLVCGYGNNGVLPLYHLPLVTMVTGYTFLVWSILQSSISIIYEFYISMYMNITWVHPIIPWILPESHPLSDTHM